jgi:hypothetical protein
LGRCNKRPQKNTNKPSITKPKHVSERNMADAHLSLFPTPTTLPIKVAIHQTRIDIEAKAKTRVKTFIVESSCEMPTPPPKVQMRRFYVLLSEIDTIMSRTTLEDPKGCFFS